MSDHKPVSPAGIFLGIALFIIYVALAVSAWALRPAKGWSIEWLAIIELGLLVGFLLGLVFLKPLQAIILWMSNLKVARFVAEHFRNDSAQYSQGNTAQPNQTAPEQFRTLRETLRADNGWRWRYRQPWLLLTGNDGAISRLLPELAASGWTTAADIVLLWSRSGQNGQPDGAWLRQLYKLRRRRPVDAIVLVTDSHADLTTDRHVAHMPGYRLASTIRSLRWHAPVFVLEATQPSSGVQGILPVVACEFPLNPDGNAIDHSLHALRDQLSDRGVFRLCKSLGDVYLAKLSCHLDTRAKVLAEWVASIPRGLGRLNPVRGIAFAPYPLAGATAAGRQAGFQR